MQFATEIRKSLERFEASRKEHAKAMRRALIRRSDASLDDALLACITTWEVAVATLAAVREARASGDCGLAIEIEAELEVDRLEDVLAKGIQRTGPRAYDSPTRGRIYFGSVALGPSTRMRLAVFNPEKALPISAAAYAE